MTEADLEDFLDEIALPDNGSDLHRLIRESYACGGKSGAPMYFSRNNRFIFKINITKFYVRISTNLIK